MAEHDFHELVGAVVAQIMIEMGVLAHIMRFAVIDRGDHVPGGAAAGHQIERGEAAGDVERFVIGGRTGRGEAELFGRHAHRGQHHDRIHLHAADAVFDGMGMIVAVAVRHRQPVVEKRHVEFAGFENPADLLIVIRRHRIVARFRMAPRTRQIGAVLRLQESDQRHLPCHAALPVAADEVMRDRARRPVCIRRRAARSLSQVASSISMPDILALLLAEVFDLAGIEHAGRALRGRRRFQVAREFADFLLEVSSGRKAATLNTAMKHPSLCRPVGSTPKPRPVSRPHSTSTIAARPLPL